MIERADQLVLNYVSKAADAAHGVLRSDQRLDFARRLRARIEAERGGSQSPREVAKLLARFGDPVALVEREARRLAAAAPGTAPGTAPAVGAAPAVRVAPAAGDGLAPGDTRRFPAIVDDPGFSPAVQPVRRPARHRQNRPAGRGLPFAGLRRAAMSSANPMATGGRDARTVLKEHPRDVGALAVLVVAALLVPFGLPALAIFPVPLVVWAAGAAIVLLSESWEVRDRFLGAGAPLLGYAVGGVLVGGLRVGAEPGLDAFMTQFWAVSGTMFMIGTGLGVLWLGYRLLDA
ncbi:hypothetical protein MF672_007135 [Actinomadura sp. ATCC 31491]|uniref:DUF1707 domain-containing protein n=1 Tax=Actinomadura luzonensis TaxID=2805427 RepID=A0ABT0FMK4_9ACTN|nr:hypothetical protein [Actinomadura luzonensis]MCK2213567.1 hypothetical protein [Actinomadura luzonensis]